MLHRRIMLLATIMLFGAGCSAVPFGSILKLSRVDFATTDLDRLRVGLYLPKGLRTKPNGVVMVSTYAPTGGAEQRTQLLLQESNDPADIVGLPNGSFSSGKSYVYRLSDKARQQLDNIRKQAKTAEAKGQKGTLSIGISTKEFCRDGTLPEGPLLSDTWLFTIETQGWVALVQKFDLRSDKTIEDSLATLSPC
jgi:hypothetical protein